MPEGVNVEIAHKLSEHDEHPAPPTRWHEVVEIVEVVVLAIVAIATAWSGYQAAKWDGRQAVLYGESSKLRFEADDVSTAGGQQLVADSAGFNSWLQAYAMKNDQLMRIYVGRFTPDYRAAFDAWIKLDPFNNPKAPPGPAYMPNYVNTNKVKAQQLNDEASAKFEEGTHARETGEKYVRDTVLFASVLFLVAMAQRLRGRGTRLALTIVAITLLGFVMISLVDLPRV